MRLWSLALCVLALTMAHLHHFYGILPELSQLYDKPTFLGTFVGLINFAGRAIAVGLLYYFVVFFRSINFFEYNPLRYHATKSSKHGGIKVLAQYTMSPLIILLVLTHFGSGFGYFTTLEHTQWIYNSTPFVLILAVVSAFGLSIVAQALFFVTIISTYAFFERMYVE